MSEKLDALKAEMEAARGACDAAREAYRFARKAYLAKLEAGNSAWDAYIAALKEEEKR